MVDVLPKYVCLSILLFLSVHAHAQVDSILAFPAEDRSRALNEWFLVTRKQTDVDKSYRQLDEMYNGLLARNETGLARQFWTLRLWFQQYVYSLVPYDESVAQVKQVIKEASDNGWTQSVHEASYILGFKLFTNGTYGEGMELMLRHYGELEKMGWSTPYFRVMINETMGDAFYRFGDYENSTHYYLEALKSGIPRNSVAYPYPGINTLGLCYSKLMQYDSATYFLNMAYDAAAERKDTIWMALTKGNLGHIYFNTGQYDKAKECLEFDYRESINMKVYGSAVNAGTLLANIELRDGNIPKAEEYIQFSRTYMDTANLDGMINFYRNLFTYHKLEGDYRKAVLYSDSLQTVIQRKGKVFDNKILDQAEVRVQIARYNAEVKSFEEARKRQIIIRNALLIILVLIAALAIGWTKRVMFKRQVAQEKLDAAQNQLAMYTKSLLEKNELIQSFREEMEKLKMHEQLPEHERSANISALMHSNILTDDDWRQFRLLFDAVYPGFLVRLKEKINDLTPAETRILALTKLQLPAKDMAEMLGISPDSIKKTRYRLRKKINLPEEGTLEELVSLI